jgi:Zn-dependent metalloprotease
MSPCPRIVCLLVGLALAAWSQQPPPGPAPDLAALPGLGPEHSLRPLETVEDPGGAGHVRYQQYYRGVRVWGGQLISHRDGTGAPEPVTDALVRDIALEVTPNLAPAEALAVAHDREAPSGAYARPPTAELVVYSEQVLEPRPLLTATGDAEDYQVKVVRHRLVYHLRLALENGAQETRHDDYLVDAHTGAVLRSWSSLLTLRPHKPGNRAVTTTGRSQYSGEVSLGSMLTDCGYVLSDPTRAHNSTRNLGGRLDGKGSLFNSAEPSWGDGENYDSGRSWTSLNGQTAAVDAHYGLQTTWDFYKNILGRNGIDGKGRSATNLVHYAHHFDNAFWDDDCFCMTYGDGSSFKTLTAIDVVGHEVSHGLCSATADLEYIGESGGLNEASSDIFGTMIKCYSRGAKAKGPKVPAEGAVWSIGEDLQTPDFPHPIRYMDKPSRDGFSPDAWSPALEDLNVHFASGPMNRAFYFLSQGASADPKSDAYSKYLPKGMKGIGNDKALRIWWRTLSTRLTPTSRYLDARRGAIQSAKEIYGKHSIPVLAVRQAFRGIHVGDCPAPKAE